MAKAKDDETFLETAISQALVLLENRKKFYEIEAKKQKVFFLDNLQIDIQNLAEKNSKILSKLVNIKEVFQIEDLSPNTVVLAYVNHRRSSNHNNVLLAKMKLELHKYINLSNELENDIALLEMEIANADEKIGCILTTTPNDVISMEQKIKKYEKELIKLQEKNTWLKNNDYDLTSIAKQVRALQAAKDEEEKLKKELSCYQGLSPDLQEAARQLAEIKKQYEEASKQLLDEMD